MAKLVLLFILAFLLTQIGARRRKVDLAQNTLAPEEQNTVIEANHFYSQTEASTLLNVGDTVKDKPLLFLMQPNNAQEDSKNNKEFNPVEVVMTSGSDKKTCKLHNFYSLCELPKLNSDQTTLSLKCDKTPCEIRWQLVQPETVDVDGKHSINHLVSVNQQKNHAILKAYCSDPELQEAMNKDLTLYTDSAYSRVDTAAGEVLYLFNNQERGRYYMTTQNSAVEKCAEVSLGHSEEEIQLLEGGYTLEDFLSNREQNEYIFKNRPDKDIFIEILAHSADMTEISNSTEITVTLVGKKGKEDHQINSLTLAIDDQKQYIDFSALFKKPEEEFNSYLLKLKSNTDAYLITTVDLVSTNNPMVELEEEAYFELKKGQKIDFKMIPIDPNITNIKSVNIFVSNSEQFKLSRDSCPREGCDFTVQALKDGQGSIYLGEDNKQKASEIVLEQFEKGVGSKMREGEEKFYMYKMKKGTLAQFKVNTPNVLVRVANRAKCDPSLINECHEKQFNYHHPTIYEAQEDLELALKVVALDNCNFAITALQTNKPYIELKDSQPFVYLMDDNQHELLFHFKLTEKVDVNFNLVSGLNELEMFTFNQADLKEDTLDEAEHSEYSLEGNICYTKDDLESKEFIIKVQKRQQYRKKYVHFTLIASTQGSNMHLEPGNAHYETMKPKGSRDFYFQTQEDKKMFLNFYTHNIQKVDLVATLSRSDEYKDKEKTAEFKLDRQTDIVDIATVSQKLCAEEVDCELFLRVVNKMEVEADLTLTLMVQDAVIELKDGIWQTYDVNEASSSAHFYFLPKHDKHSITIFYHSPSVELKLGYTLWKSDDTSIDITSWPFPQHVNQEDPSPKNMQNRPIRFIHIEHTQLKACWPDCVVLLSIIPNQKQLENLQKKPTPFFTQYHNFRIMASNNLVEIPEKTKLDMVLNRGEEKYLLVDLKYFMNKESLIFFTYLTMGSISFKANVYTEKQPRCPTNAQFQADYHFYGVENEVTIQDIKVKMESNGMEEDKSPYLCILAYAFLESKFSIEYVSQIDSIKDIPVDTTTAVSMGRDQVRMFQMNAHFKTYLKIARTSGFPFIAKKLCNPVDNLEQCLEDFRQSDDKGQQLVNKIMEINEQPCVSCMLYIKVTSAEEVQLSMHAQSSFAQVDLKEGQPLTDVVGVKQMNRYLITGTKNKQIIINVNIISGNVKVEVVNYGKINFSKENAKGTNNIHIVIPSEDLNEDKEKDAKPVPYLGAYSLSSFTNLHVTVKSQDESQPANYIITYSNGGQTSYLEDGLISQYTLTAHNTSKFLFNPVNYRMPVYLYISTAEAATLNNLHTKIFGLENEGDEENRMELVPERPAFKKKTVNPTILLHFSGKGHYRIEIENKNKENVLLSIGINSRQIIYLPLEHEFPFKIDPKQNINVVISVPHPGYLTFSVNKCDASQPYIAYTEDYKEFLDEEFESQEQLADQLSYRNVIHVKKAGALYIRIRAGELQASTMTIKASFSATKIENVVAKAGDKGVIEYQLLDSTKSELTISAVVCEGKCSGSFTYSAIYSHRIDLIYSHLVCTAVSFDYLTNSKIEQPNIEPITAGKSDSKITFHHTLSHDTEYIGVKAVNAKTGAVVYYPPVELINLAGKVNKALEVASKNNNPQYLIAVLVILSICCALIAYRRYKRRQQSYLPLGGQNYDD